MKANFSLYGIRIAAFIFVLLLSCSKDSVEDKKDPAISTAAIEFNPNLSYGTMTDKSGNSYKTILIDTMTWMAENLRTTKFRNGLSIPEVTADTIWPLLSSSACCSYLNDTLYSKIYGRLYNFAAVIDANRIAPLGWHVPTDAEWQALISFLDVNADFSSDWGVVSTSAGGLLKEKGTVHWFSPNLGGDNSSGFTALPGGVRDAYADFTQAGKACAWWTSSTALYGPVYYEVSNVNSAVYRGTYPGSNGYAVRLVKD